MDGLGRRLGQRRRTPRGPSGIAIERRIPGATGRRRIHGAARAPRRRRARSRRPRPPPARPGAWRRVARVLSGSVWGRDLQILRALLLRTERKRQAWHDERHEKDRQKPLSGASVGDDLALGPVEGEGAAQVPAVADLEGVMPGFDRYLDRVVHVDRPDTRTVDTTSNVPRRTSAPIALCVSLSVADTVSGPSVPADRPVSFASIVSPAITPEPCLGGRPARRPGVVHGSPHRRVGTIIGAQDRTAVTIHRRDDQDSRGAGNSHGGPSCVGTLLTPNGGTPLRSATRRCVRGGPRRGRAPTPRTRPPTHGRPTHRPISCQ